MAKPWDDSMKMLVRANPQALVSLLLPDAKFQGEQDRELKARTVEADLLYNVIWRGRKIILHVEFQLCAAKNMARRVWEYNVLTDYLTGCPVYSVVIYKNAPEDCHLKEADEWRKSLTFYTVSVKV